MGMAYYEFQPWVLQRSDELLGVFTGVLVWLIIQERWAIAGTIGMLVAAMKFVLFNCEEHLEMIMQRIGADVSPPCQEDPICTWIEQ